MTKSKLDEIEGIGEKKRTLLLKTFGSVKKIKEASIEDLETVLNHDVAQNLYKYLKELE